MNIDKLTKLIEQEWEKPEGFFGKLREGIFDSSGLERVKQLLEKVELKPEDKLNRRLVAVTWYIPLFTTWQEERVQENGGDVNALKDGNDSIQSLLVKILGVP